MYVASAFDSGSHSSFRLLFLTEKCSEMFTISDLGVLRHLLLTQISV